MVVFCVDDVKVNVIPDKVVSSVDLAVVISTVDGPEEADTSLLVDTCCFKVVSLVGVFCVEVSVTRGVVIVFVVEVPTVSVVLIGSTVVALPEIVDVVSDDAAPVPDVVVADVPGDRVVFSWFDVTVVDVKVVVDKVDSVVCLGLTGVVSDTRVVILVKSLILIVVSCKFVVVEAKGFVVSSFTVVGKVSKVGFVVDTNEVDVKRSKEGVTHESNNKENSSVVISFNWDVIF